MVYVEKEKQKGQGWDCPVFILPTAQTTALVTLHLPSFNTQCRPDTLNIRAYAWRHLLVTEVEFSSAPNTGPFELVCCPYLYLLHC